MINPYFIYILSFLSVLIVYTFGWSTLYPVLSANLIIFFIINFAVSLYLGIRYKKRMGNYYEKVEYDKKNLYITIFIILGYIAEFIYCGGAPLISHNINYLEFKGIPTFHVFLYTFNIFFAIYLFHLFISTKSKLVLLLYIMTILPSILIISRGMFVNIFIGSAFVYLQKVFAKYKVTLKRITPLFVIILIMFYLFGMFGNYRSNIKAKGNKFSSNYILMIGEANKSFKKSIIPKEYFWGYLYISSPLANLQKNINSYKPDINLENFRKFVTVEIIPDFISKRISGTYAKDKVKNVVLISKYLVVGTFYMGSYYFLGWTGMMLLFVYFIVFSLLYIKLLSKENIFYVTAIAMLCNIIALNTFSNMFSFSGMSLQLVYPILYAFFSWLKPNFPRYLEKFKHFNKKAFVKMR